MFPRSAPAGLMLVASVAARDEGTNSDEAKVGTFTLPEIVAKPSTVVGHSLLGKTAVWAGAQDQRFAEVALKHRDLGERNGLRLNWRWGLDSGFLDDRIP